ncbi:MULTISPECIES: fimbrial protein [unclassified Serratia (in: enterobacteria)]|uniref:fimbrial protein n=1 Tax=unclassified Serratia (in: enterobacteria) TaxID=2647522 RepID=UPI001378F584|nr:MULTISPECIES: fimbrial protein [unclassified Serratia (in: enterobacteria)]
MKTIIASRVAVSLILCAGLYAQSALAVTPGCDWDSTSAIFSPLDTRLTIGGSVTVGEDLPVGSVIYSQRIQTSGNGAKLFCQAGIYDLVSSFTSTPYGQSSYSDPTFPFVFNTNIPGIGVALWQGTPDGGSARLLIPGSLTGYLSNSSSSVFSFTSQSDASVSFNIEFIKTASSVGSGTISRSDLPSFETSLNGNGENFVYQKTSISGSLTVIPATCNVGSNYYLPLGEHYPDEFNGVGSTAGSAETQIVLSGCPAFYGRTSYSVFKPNVISIKLTPRNGFENAEQGISKLNVAGGDAAEGVGVQLSFKQENGNYQLAKFNQDIDLADYITFLEDRGSDYNLGVKATYIQTATPIRAGKADAQIEFMITYQ